MRGTGCVIWLLVALCCTALPRAQGSPPAEVAVTGRIVDEAGRPIRGAVIGVMPYSQPDTEAVLRAPLATSDADGKYRIEFSPQHGTTVTAIAAGRQLASAMVASDGVVPVYVGFQLLPGAVLSGVVRDAAGAPLPGAQVEAREGMPSVGVMRRLSVASTRSDAAGAFRLHGVATTGLCVTATLPGYFMQTCFAHANAPLALTLHPSGFVRGRIVDERGEPRAHVLLHDGASPYPSVRSDAAGNFELPVSHRGTFRIYGQETGQAGPGSRSYRSSLLDGPGTGVDVRANWFPDPRAELVTVRCVDATTKAPIAAFHASRIHSGIGADRWAMFWHFEARRPCDETFRFERVGLAEGETDVVVVDAPGRAAAISRARGSSSATWVIELEPESVLTGRVLDAATGRPLAGAAVVALPPGESTPAPARLRDAARTDAEGRYRLGGLSAGDFSVQAFAAGRPASREIAVQLARAATAELDLVAPAQRWLDLALAGARVPGVACELEVRPALRDGFCNPLVAWWQQVLLGDEPRARIGPVDSGQYSVNLHCASRVRMDVGTWYELGTVDPEKGASQLTLPAHGSTVVRGKVVLPAGVPAARIGVLAHGMPVPPPMSPRGVQVAGLRADASFAFDLAHGGWLLQLVDLETRIVFHTEAKPHTVGSGVGELTIEPRIHWLEIECVGAGGVGAPTFSRLSIGLPAPPKGGWALFSPMQTDSQYFGRHAELPFHDVGTTARWLVPHGAFHLSAYREVESDEPHSTRDACVGSAQVDVDAIDRATRVVITIAAAAK